MRVERQVRFETAFHESAHAVSQYFHGHPIAVVRIFTLGGSLLPDPEGGGDIPGYCMTAPVVIKNVCDAQRHIVDFLAGEAGVRIAWALEVLSDDDIGGEKAEEEPTVDELLAVPQNGDKATRAAAYGRYVGRSERDEENARGLAREFTDDPLEAAALLDYCTHRTAAMVKTERFQRLTGVLASALMERSELDGKLATHLLDRADQLEKYRDTSTSTGG